MVSLNLGKADVGICIGYCRREEGDSKRKITVASLYKFAIKLKGWQRCKNGSQYLCKK